MEPQVSLDEPYNDIIVVFLCLGLLLGHFFGLLLCLFPLCQLQEWLDSYSSVEGFEKRFFVRVVQRSLEAEDLNPRRWCEIFVLIQILIKISAIRPAQESNLTVNSRLAINGIKRKADF